MGVRSELSQSITPRIAGELASQLSVVGGSQASEAGAHVPDAAAGSNRRSQDKQLGGGGVDGCACAICPSDA